MELASGVVILQVAKVRDQHPGPETRLWLFAQGAGPSWLAAALYLATAAFLVFAGTL